MLSEDGRKLSGDARRWMSYIYSTSACALIVDKANMSQFHFVTCSDPCRTCQNYVIPFVDLSYLILPIPITPRLQAILLVDEMYIGRDVFTSIEHVLTDGILVIMRH